jgi:predicted CXXCH cytochrome family protein
MKKLLMLILTLSLVSISSVAFAIGSGMGIAGSPHDFTQAPYGFTTEICIVCHTPHDGGRAVTATGLLWNHDLSTATYTMYDQTTSPTLDGAVDPQPSGISKLCLACHDGTVAIDSYGGATGTIYIPLDFQIPRLTDGTNLDLRGTHPISIVYDDTADINLKDPNTTAMGLSGTIADVLEGGKVQCSTCHDVHDQESVGNTPLLRVDNTNSALCLTCHIK